MADHFEEVIGLRVAALEARAAAEADSVKEHFAELQKFITFTATTQVTQLKAEIHGLQRRFDQLEQRSDRLERKLDGHHDAMRLILADILDRLPARNG